jgi:CheY-like chemotaxis protein
MTKRVLIVDDEPMIRRSLEMLFEMFGFEEAVSAEDGQAGLAELEQSIEPFDLIVTDFDYKNPEMDGLGFLEAIQSRNIPTIMHSATDGIREKAILLEAIFVDKSANSVKDLKTVVYGLFPSMDPSSK